MIAVSGWRLGTQTSQRQLCRDAVPTLPRDSGCDVIASLPRSAEDEGEEGEDQDDDDDEAAAVGAAAVDTPLPLIVEFAVGAHFVRS